MALTADEEGGPANGVQYLLKHHFDLIKADFVINEGGGGIIQDGKHAINAIQAAEKVYQFFRLEVTNAGGHSSRPRAESVQTPNDAKHIEGLLGLKPSFESIAYFEQQANFNALLRTTCVASQLEAGHA